MLSSRHLLGLKDYPREDIQTIINTSFQFREVLERPIKKVPSLQGNTIVNLFFENSTRTRISFELAQKRLSADSINFSSSGSSLKKGESFKDTVQNIEAMKIDAVVMRHPSPGSALKLTEYIDAVVVNAGDGMHEHPTQAILDMMSLYEKFGYLKGLKIGIIGDIAHSRVARSNIYGLSTMGADLTLCGPATLLPLDVNVFPAKISHSLDEVIDWADAIIVLRLQMERMGQKLIPSIRDYRALFGITSDRIKNHNKKITVMHPGPINRGVEIDSNVADGENSIILNQVLNGVASRMAILYLLLGKKVKSMESK